MPIVQLQSEFIAPPEYTWATKPAAAGNVGREIILTDLGRSRWRSDGNHWRPANGVFAVSVDMTGLSTTSTSHVPVVGVPSVIVPIKDWLLTPGCTIESDITVQRENPSSSQQFQVTCLIGGLTLCRVSAQNTSPTVIARGICKYYSQTQYMSALNAEPYFGSFVNPKLLNLSGISDGLVNVEVHSSTGDTGGSEVATFSPVRILVSM